jgi:hypothetical protein
MKKIDLGQAVTILANLGVIAGILFLATEIQQNNRLLRAQSSYNMLQNRMDVRSQVWQDPEIAELFRKERVGEELSDLDEVRIMARSEEGLLMYEWEYHQYLEGNLSQLPIDRYRANMSSRSAMRRAYQQLKNTGGLSPEFVEWMEAEILVD